MVTLAQAQDTNDGVDWTGGVEDAFASFMEVIPKLLAFLVILVIGFLIAKMIGKAVNKLLEKAGFDRLVERGAVRNAMARSKYDASDIAGKLAYYALALLTLVLAFGVFGSDNPVSRLLSSVVAFIPKIVVAIIIVLVAAAIASWVKDIVSNALGGLSYGNMLGTIASAAILITGIFAALTQLEIAPAIVTGLFYALLAILVGVTVVAVGGGGIQPMRARWERALSTVDVEGPRLKEQARIAKEQRAQQDYSQQQGDQSAPPAAPPAGARSAGYAEAQQPPYPEDRTVDISREGQASQDPSKTQRF